MGLFLGSVGLLYVSMSVLCWYHTVLITTDLYYLMKSGNVIIPALFCFLQIDLAIHGLSWFHTKFRITCSSSVNNTMSILIGIA